MHLSGMSRIWKTVWRLAVLLPVVLLAASISRLDGSSTAPTGLEAKALHWFPLPREATIVRAEQDYFEFERKVRFRLPRSRTPEAWLRRIAEDYRIGKSQQSRYRYSFRNGLRRVEYFPAQNLYEIYFYED